MPAESIVLAADHAGFGLKEILRKDLEAAGLKVLDLGTHTLDSVDYPDYGRALAAAIREGRARRGILVCGTGIGISIAANREPAVRCAVCHDVTSARLAREQTKPTVEEGRARHAAAARVVRNGCSTSRHDNSASAATMANRATSSVVGRWPATASSR